MTALEYASSVSDRRRMAFNTGAVMLKMPPLGRRLTLWHLGSRTILRHYHLTSGYNRPSWTWARIPLALGLYIPPSCSHKG